MKISQWIGELWGWEHEQKEKRHFLGLMVFEIKDKITFDDEYDKFQFDGSIDWMQMAQ